MRSELGVAAFARMVMTVLALVLPVVAEGKEDFPVAAKAPLASNEEGLPQLRAQMAALEGQIGQLRAAMQQLDEESSDLADRAAELLAMGPVLAAYDAALDGAPAPTEYGESHIKESFAESFALFRADPEALERVLPRVHAWFQAGGHLRALRGGPDS